jgi:hypothetical protein
MQMFVIDYAAYGEKPHGPYAARQIAENLGKLKEAESARNREAERVNRAVRRSNEQLGCILNFDGPFEDPGRKLV